MSPRIAKRYGVDASTIKRVIEATICLLIPILVFGYLGVRQAGVFSSVELERPYYHYVVNSYPCALSSNEGLATEIGSVASGVPEKCVGSPQRGAKYCYCNSRKNRDGSVPSIKKFAEMPEVDKDYIVSGAVFVAGLLVLANLAVYITLKYHDD